MRMVEPLTKRELQCLRLAAEDKTLHETADNLCISYNTVRTHRRYVLRKMGCQSMTAALMKAISYKLIDV